ncbi:MAG TPA: glucosidase, partial [Flavisolibacter sp.]|nr:glucosidase [Flavisolibacter sp.]
MAEQNNGFDWLNSSFVTPAEKRWGPYISDRQWGTVREDYSADGQPWIFTTHDMARSKAYRWGEEGIAGICDDQQLLCFALALWNGKDPILKERYFGLTNGEGNHGEDVKELYYYLDSTPTHSYMKMLYKYPQAEFPYRQLVEENRRRTRQDPEFEIIDTGIFDDNAYFDVFVEYAKAGVDDLLIKLTITNRGEEDATLHVLPTLWFRNTWAWGYDNYQPQMISSNKGGIIVDHEVLGRYYLHLQTKGELLFCDNETNNQRLYGVANKAAYVKDGINDYLVNSKLDAVNPDALGTKAAVHYRCQLAAGQTLVLKLRLETTGHRKPFKDFDDLFARRQKEADAFYKDLQKDIESED